ncbi:GNAT family N-acetyltransferase [Nocardioides caeni]|uniref:GNAT family N-acetyltransferase n=1 Tax=Nocardioides caeni TaxID=574700 RepID=A0A4S8N422_9ACTN|nr:GNAT family N-acetyltransferase [Nocardioides caeni]THV10807.1 GNAT family N-acetyltransferase [Nocardioides caeni]
MSDLLSTLEIVELGPDEVARLREWAAVTAQSARHELGDDATAWAAEEIIAIAQEQSRRRKPGFHAAILDGEVVATGWVSLPLLDNLDSAEVDVHVRPDLRRRGIGTRLLEHVESVARAAGRSRFDSETCWPYAGPADGAGTPGAAFARKHGYGFGLVDVQRALAVPVDEALLAELAAEAAPRHADYRIESWHGPIPDPWVESWLTLANTLNSEAPTGDMEREDDAGDVAAQREAEESQARQGRTSWQTVALVGDEVVAYTEVVLPTHDQRFAYQWGTLVHRDHRGHRLGMAVKVANLQAMQRGADVRGRRVVTWNAEVNDHMIGINERLGFVPVARGAELQKKPARDR